MWSDLPKFRHLGNILKALVGFVKVYLVFGQILNLLSRRFIGFIGFIFTAEKWPNILNK